MNDGDGKEATYGSMRWVAVIGSMFLSWVLTVAQKNDEGLVKNYGQAQRPERLVPQGQFASPLINSRSRQGGNWMQDVVCLNHSFGEVGWLLPDGQFLAVATEVSGKLAFIASPMVSGSHLWRDIANW